MSREALDTIVAPATPLGRSALAIVRIDGPRAPAILRELSRQHEFENRVATFTRFYDGDAEIDEGVAIVYGAPRSFTGNDLVEVTLHGSPFIVERFIRAVTSRGARHAEAGEFSERAVLNGKLDLIQAESIADLIGSRTAVQARLSLSNLDGELSARASEIRARLLSLISRLEAALDFADEGYEFISAAAAKALLDEAVREAEGMAATFRRGRATIEGLDAVILGKPNAGKSTLLNFLVGSERAIVTPVPGTTRDLLRETVEIGGLPVTLTDTAGIRLEADSVEEIGIGRARAAAAAADLVLYLVDASAGLTDEDRTELDRLRNAFIIYTKVDLAPAPSDALGISVKTRAGLDELLIRLDTAVREAFAPPEGTATIVNERQHRAVVDCIEAMRSAREGLDAGAGEDIVLVDLYRASSALGLLTGAISHGEILREIFGKFCIGK